MTALRDFLFDHMNHNLTYGMNDILEPSDGWTEVDANKYKNSD